MEHNKLLAYSLDAILVSVSTGGHTDKVKVSTRMMIVVWCLLPFRTGRVLAQGIPVFAMRYGNELRINHDYA